MRKSLYIVLASINLCIIIIAILSILNLKNHKKTNIDNTEMLVTDNSNIQVTENKLEKEDANLNNDITQDGENNNFEEVIANVDNDNSQNVVSTNSKKLNKRSNSEVIEYKPNKSYTESKGSNSQTSNNNSNKASTESEEKIIQNNNSKTNEQEKTEVTLNLEKYDRYEKALNGGYKCFKKNTAEISKLKNLISQAIEEFGYTDVKIKEDKSIVSNRYFTANKTNVENGVYDSEGFTIHYYAETEYNLTADGIETVFQVRSYIKVK